MLHGDYCRGALNIWALALKSGKIIAGEVKYTYNAKNNAIDYEG